MKLSVSPINPVQKVTLDLGRRKMKKSKDKTCDCNKSKGEQCPICCPKWRYSFTISKGKDKRCYTRKDCDIIALAALDIESVLFFPVESFTRNRSLTLTKNDFRNPSDGEEGVHFQMALVYSQNMQAEILKMDALKREYKIKEVERVWKNFIKQN